MTLAAFLALLVVFALLAIKFLSTHRIAEEPKPRVVEAPTDKAKRDAADLLLGFGVGSVVFLFVGSMGWVKWSTLLSIGLLGLFSFAGQLWRLRRATLISSPIDRSRRTPIVGIAVSVGLMISVIIAMADDEHALEVIGFVAIVIGLCWAVRGLIRKRREPRQTDV